MSEEAILPRWVKITGGCVVLFWFVCGGLSAAWSGNFDSLAALFSGLAFVGLIATLVYQRHELIIQRNIQKQSQEELAKTAEANKHTAELAQKNLRMQYLFFWLEMNKERYNQLRELRDKLEKASSSGSYELFYNIIKGFAKVASAVAFSMPISFEESEKPRIAQEFGPQSHHAGQAADNARKKANELMVEYIPWMELYEKNQRNLEELSGISTKI